MSHSLELILKRRKNNYSKVAALFKKETGVDIIDGYTEKVALTKSCSIIIPFGGSSSNYKALKKSIFTLCRQSLPLSFTKSMVEVIIVDDGSLVNIEKLKNVFRQLKENYSVVYLKLKRNYGRAVARNLGLLYAQNEVVLFLDSDVIVNRQFLRSHLLRHEFDNKSIIVGFYKHIVNVDCIKEKNFFNKNRPAILCYKNDFRYERFIPIEWKKLFNNVPVGNFGKMWHVLRDSDYFRNFGEGKVVGVWDLPFMFLTGNASVLKKYIIKVGGFDLRFKDYGLEDTYLGAKLISLGLYLIPNLNATAYHVKVEGEKKSRKKSLKNNLGLYKKLKKCNIGCTNESDWRRVMTKYFKNKFQVIGF